MAEMSEQKDVDFFISYTSADEAWGEWISWVLEEAGYRVVFQKWDFAPGTNFVLEMDQAARTAKRTILVLSSAIRGKPFPASEWAVTFRADPDGRLRKLVPVRVANVSVEGLLGSIAYIDLLGLDHDTAARRLLEGLRERAKPSEAPSFPGASHGAAPAFPGPMVPVADASTGHTVALPTERLDVGEVGAAFVTPEGGRPDRSGYGGIGILRLLVEPEARFDHPAGIRLRAALEAATREAAERVGEFVKPSASPKAFDWIGNWTPRGSFGWMSGRASEDFDFMSRHVLVAATYAFDPRSLSFLISMGLAGEDGQGKVAFEHVWVAEMVGVLLIAGAFYAAVEPASVLRVDVALQGLDGAVSSLASRGRAFTPDQPKITDPYYLERVRVIAHQLAGDPRDVVRTLLDRLLLAVDEGVDIVSRVAP